VYLLAVMGVATVALPGLIPVSSAELPRATIDDVTAV